MLQTFSLHIETVFVKYYNYTLYVGVCVTYLDKLTDSFVIF